MTRVRALLLARRADKDEVEVEGKKRKKNKNNSGDNSMNKKLINFNYQISI